MGPSTEREMFFGHVDGKGSEKAATMNTGKRRY